MQTPSIGRIVHYRLSAEEADKINYDRKIWSQTHKGNEVHEGDSFPMIITRVWGTDPTSAVNGQVFLDGNDVLWATSVCVGEGPRTFSWPVRS